MANQNQKFSLEEVLKVTQGRLYQGNSNLFFKEISTDSRKIKGEELFIALKGEHFDGHQFVLEALKRGSKGALVKEGFFSPNNSSLPLDKVIIEVKDPLYSLGELAHFWREKYSIPLVAVTGSNGKTTTKELIAAILENKGKVLKSEGNWNNLIGLPLSLLRLSKEHEFAVLEMGMNQRGEIKRLAEISRPDLGLITNIAPAHLQYLGSLKEIREAKGELFESLDKGKKAIVNNDDLEVIRLAKRCSASQITFGIKNPSQVRAKGIFEEEARGVKFRLNRNREEVSLALPLYGLANVYNALAAAAVATALEIDMETIKKGLEKIRPLSGRMEIIDLNQGIKLINDSYNANPQSMTLALRTLVKLKGERRGIVVVGDMLELGRKAKSWHVQMGKLIGRMGIDYLLSIGEFAPAWAEGAIVGGMEEKRIMVGKEIEEIIFALRKVIKKRDWILVKGSRKMRMERMVEELSKFFPKNP